MIATRVMVVLGGLLMSLAGWWARSHSDATPRYSAGYGSGFSPEARRFVGSIVLTLGLLVVLSGVTGIPHDIFAGTSR